MPPRKISDIAGSVMDLIRQDFPLTRLSAATTPEQLLREITNIPVDRLPAVIVIVDSGSFTDRQLTRELTMGLAVIDRFVAAGDDRVVSSWDTQDLLQSYFPAAGTEIEGCAFLPSRFYPVKSDVNLATYVLELRVLQPLDD